MTHASNLSLKQRLTSFGGSLFEGRFALLGDFLLVFLLINAVTRTLLLLGSFSNVNSGMVDLLKIYSFGFFFDLVNSFYFMIPAVLYLTFVPDPIFRSRLHKPVAHLFFLMGIYILCYGVVAEWLFWDEFGKRFNFIAVDYLVYTTEVVGNIMESYPVLPLLLGLVIPTLLIFILMVSYGRGFKLSQQPSVLKQRLLSGGMFVMFAVVSFCGVESSSMRLADNAFNDQLSRNGLYELFAAFRNNDLDFDTYYEKSDDEKVLARFREMVLTDNSRYLQKEPTQILRRVENSGQEKRLNVMFITIESLSAEYMGAFGNKAGLTPNMDQLTKDALFFDNLYATGTRSVRGLEALTLSTVPMAGRSIVKRPENQGMFSLGKLFKERGYDTRWIYGGYGYFDNMNAFFSGNGFAVVDRTDFKEDEKSFGNIWGVCDGDLFSKALKEADASYAAGRPFLNFMLTTSNHRPYTYPEGKIDIPSKTGRAGGVKYTDYAVGEFLKKAAKRPWFDDTVFILVADHCGSSAGRTSLPMRKYEIPLIIYSPKHIPAERVSKLCSQIDVAPTLLALLNWSYDSKFLGRNILTMKPEDERAFVGTYQKLGFYRGARLTVISPGGGRESYAYDRITKEQGAVGLEESELFDTISWYQAAAKLYREGLTRWKDGA